MWRGSRDDMEKKKLRDRSYREGRASAIRVAQNSTSTNKAMFQLLNDIRHDYATVMSSESAEKEAHVMVVRIDAALAQLKQ